MTRHHALRSKASPSTPVVSMTAMDMAPDGLNAETFVERWNARLVVWSSLPTQVDGAAVARLVLAEFAAFERGVASQPLTLAEAGAETGLSASHLGRLVRDARVPNAGSKNRPLIRRADLPAAKRRRPKAPDGRASQSTYDPEADAAVLRGRRG